MTRQQTRKRVAQWAALGAVGAVALGLSGWGTHALHASETAAPAAASPVLRHEGARLVVPPGSALRSSVQVAPVTRGDVDVPFTLSERHRRMFLEGLDMIGATLALSEKGFYAMSFLLSLLRSEKCATSGAMRPP